jgi:hypothetical protein
MKYKYYDVEMFIIGKMFYYDRNRIDFWESHYKLNVGNFFALYHEHLMKRWLSNEIQES